MLEMRGNIHISNNTFMNNQEENNTSGKFCLRLLETMARRSLNQKELADLTDLSQGAVSKYLRGQALPKSLELYKLSKALGVTMEWLLGDDGSPPTDESYWRREAERLKTKLHIAVNQLESVLKSLR